MASTYNFISFDMIGNISINTTKDVKYIWEKLWCLGTTLYHKPENKTLFSWSSKPNQNIYTCQTLSVKYPMTLIDIDVLFLSFYIFITSTLTAWKKYFHS